MLSTEQYVIGLRQTRITAASSRPAMIAGRHVPRFGRPQPIDYHRQSWCPNRVRSIASSRLFTLLSLPN
jgi:hypothetical protein